MPFLSVNNLSLYFRLRRSQRVKRLQLHFHYDGFEVVAPPRLSNFSVLAFLWEKRMWMVKMTSREPSSSLLSKPVSFYEENKLYFRGRWITMSLEEGSMPQIILPHENNLVCALPSIEHDRVQGALLHWLRQQAEKIIQTVVNRVCPILGKWPSKISLRDQKTRWGSCGIHDAIQINWRLIFAPEGILEYVVVHELCHLLHRNHGIRFWQKVEKCYPDYKLARRWLTKQGDHLMGIRLGTVFSAQKSFRTPVESL